MKYLSSLQMVACVAGHVAIDQERKGHVTLQVVKVAQQATGE